MSEGLLQLWPTTVLSRRHPDADAIQPGLLKILDRELERAGRPVGPVFSSGDDLLQRYDRSALKRLFSFVSDAVFALAEASNAAVWAQLDPQRVRVEMVGAWCQRTNRFGHHDVHNHGNCAFSGVYYVQVDPDAQRRAHPSLGASNGVTRFYGPHLTHLGGAHMDLGRAFLQQPHHDVAPEEGRLVVFPSHLLHQALPYDGERDRVIVSFNARVVGETSNQAYRYGF